VHRPNNTAMRSGFRLATHLFAFFCAQRMEARNRCRMQDAPRALFIASGPKAPGDPQARQDPRSAGPCAEFCTIVTDWQAFELVR
jgi:hypothetical protein